MKKIYETPILEEEKVEIEDVIAASFGVGLPGDSSQSWPFNK